MGLSLRTVIIGAVTTVFVVCTLLWSMYESYRIRLYPVRIYGRIVHEFDPWFNYRAAQYLAEHGHYAFMHWFDHRSWYPIGRPVGTTIYPAMQYTAVAIWRFLQGAWAHSVLGSREIFSVAAGMSLKDVVVFVPAWFSVISTVSVAFITREATRDWIATAISAACMAIVPAHLMRTVAGVFDNECVAVPAMCLCFALWCRSLRSRYSWPLAALSGLAYAYMAAAWGGYIFAGNMVAVHAAAMYLLGHRTPQLTYAFSLWWLFGTIPASFVPIVGTAPFRSLEQAAPMGIFFGLWVLRALDAVSYFLKHNEEQAKRLRLYVVSGSCLLGVVLIIVGAFSPLSARVRSLFFTHTRTGNPLVDSVAEHQPATSASYRYTLGPLFYLLFIGAAILIGQGLRDKEKETKPHFGKTASRIFVLSFLVVTYFFSSKMNRLLLLLGPVAAVLGGVTVAAFIRWSLSQLETLLLVLLGRKDLQEDENNNAAHAVVAAGKGERSGKVKKMLRRQAEEMYENHPLHKIHLDVLIPTWEYVINFYKSELGLYIRVITATALLAILIHQTPIFWKNCDIHARNSASPHIMFQAQFANGQTQMVTDYLDGYLWMKNNTPEDSRILAWWDYGYHISGIAERISLADGNTWNLEHIATIGRMLASPERKGWELARHLADYVMVWAGKTADDIGKSPHISRIGSSVYPDICPNDPLCYSFSVSENGVPTKRMAASMLYKMHGHNVIPGVHVNPELFEEVYTSKYGFLRLFKILNISEESKAWCADPKNYACDRPGSWYCPGQYPPGFPKPPKTHRQIDYDKAAIMAAQRSHL